MTIKDRYYNAAREILVEAGSKSAEKSHKKHTKKGNSPDGHGTSLLEEAQAEGISDSAIQKAADKMGIDVP